MATYDRIDLCPKCDRPFGVRIWGDFPAHDDESIFCPHCHHNCGTFRVRHNYDTMALPPDEEAAYKAKRKPNDSPT